jgi:hypothetical protein
MTRQMEDRIELCQCEMMDFLDGHQMWRSKAILRAGLCWNNHFQRSGSLRAFQSAISSALARLQCAGLLP